MSQPDDIYPNDGSFFGVPVEPEEQVVARKKEQAKALEAKSVIADVVRHFEERIDFRDSLSAIRADISRDPLLHQKLCEVNDLLKLALIEEKYLLEELLEVHAKNL